MTKTNALRLLDQAGIPYVEREYSVDDGRIDALSIAEKLGMPPEMCFKTLVTESPDHRNFVFVISAGAELDLKKAARAAGTKSIDLIPLKKLLPLTGYIHGGCSPVGMKKLFPTFIDESALLSEAIGVSAGRVGLNVALAPDALASLIGAQFADLEK